MLRFEITAAAHVAQTGSVTVPARTTADAAAPQEAPQEQPQ